MTRLSLVVLCLLVMAGTTGSAAAQYRLVRTVPAPSYAAQASFYNPVRDELVIIAVDGTTAQIYNSAGDIVRPSAPLPAALGELTDGAAYDAASGVALVIRQSCELLELDPVTLSISARRTLVGSGTIAPPMICAGVDVGSDGQLYVLDHSMSRVVVYPRTATVPVRDFPVALGSLDNLAHEPGTDQLVIASNEVSSFIVYRESGELVAGPSALGTAIVLGEHTRSNTAGSDGLTFVGSTGRLWFCDHNTPVLSCYLQVRSCTAAADCPLPFIGCDVAMGICASATCGDGNIEGGEECDDGDAMGGDGCSAGCVVEPGFVCNGEPSVCGTCTDDTPFMVDTGCVAARPHCRTTGPRAPACEACIDSSPDLGDLGCTPAAPFCIRTVAGINTCVECNVDIDCDDRVECTTDTCSGNTCSHTSRPEGEVCSIGVCGGPGDDRCVECVSDAQCMPGFVCHPGRFCMPVFTDAGTELPDASITLPDAAFVFPDAAIPLPDAAMPLPDASMARDAGRADGGSGGLDAGSESDAGPLGGTFVGGAVCSASSTPTGSRATWALALAALGLVLSRRRSNRR